VGIPEDLEAARRPNCQLGQGLRMDRLTLSDGVCEHLLYSYMYSRVQCQIGVGEMELELTGNSRQPINLYILSSTLSAIHSVKEEAMLLAV
jgi:hypothetical protein